MTLTPPTPFIRHTNNYSVLGNPGLIEFNPEDDKFIGLANRYSYNVVGNYILTQQGYRFYKARHNSDVKQETLFEFTFRGANFRVHKNHVDCDVNVSGSKYLKYYHGRKEYFRIIFPFDKPFDIRNVDHMVNATMYVSAGSLVKERREREVDYAGLEYPPLIDIYQTYRDTRGESWDE